MAARYLGTVLLVLSAVAFASAPLVLDSSYSWVDHTTSESGAQGVGGAWLARTGFVLFGLAVLYIASKCAAAWSRIGRALHVVFGVCMILVAAYSLRSWMPDATYDTTEDALHSVAATTMGFAYAFGVVAVALARRRRPLLRDLVAVVSATALPIAMAANGSIDGLLQRSMFVVAYIWYAAEELRIVRLTSDVR